MLSVSCALAVALGILYFGLHSRRQFLRLPELPLGQGTHDVDVIIPARNEAQNIARVVRSFAGHRVTVVDDDSADGTGVIAAEAGARVVPAQKRPEGWLGKPNACWSGAQATDGAWLLFVDADTWYEPEFLPSLLAHAVQERLGAASVFPRQVCLSWPERTLLPYAFGLYFCGVNADAVNDERRPEALANGQCLLIRREAYKFLGGHAAVASSVIEDVALAQVFKRHRLKARVFRAERLAQVRMYDSFGSLSRGFQKNSFRFLLANPWSGVKVICASILMTSWLPLAVWLWKDGWPEAAVSMYLVPLIAWAGWFGRWQTWRAPFAVYLFQLIALLGMTKTILGLKTAWKGRPV